MPATHNFAIETLLSLFDKRDNTENLEQDINDIPPGEKLAIVIAALTLLVAMIPLFRCTRFRRWVSSISVSSYVKKAFGITLAAPASPTITTPGEFSPIPVAEILRPRPASIHNHHTNAHSIRILSNNFPYGLDTIPMEHDRVAPTEESLELTRPKPALTWPIQ